MNTFLALFVATLAVAAQAGHVPSSWPLTSYGVDSWNGLNIWSGLNSLNTHAAYPYEVNQWASSSVAWPVHSAYNGWYGYEKTALVVQTTVAKVNPWGLPLAHTGYGYGFNNYLGASVIPVASKYVAANPVHVAPLVGHAVEQKLIVA